MDVTAMADGIDPALRRDRILLDILSDKWAMLVLGSLCDHSGARRFNAIRRDVPGISQRSLTFCLRRLERSGLILRRVMDGAPLGVEYRLTELGWLLDAPLTSLFQWTADHADKIRDAQREFDRLCAQ